MKSFDSILSAIDDIREGKVVIVVDDENRENEGDFICAAEKITPEIINFMATHGRGLICAPITSQLAKNLNLHPMVGENSSGHGTAFTISVDLKDQTTTGISAADRAHTILGLINPLATADDFLGPGHTFPLVAKDGGVLAREGHTEAAVDLARLANLTPAGVICEIMNTDGTMARLDDLKILAEKLQLKLISIEDLKTFILQNQALWVGLALPFPSDYGLFDLYEFNEESQKEDANPHLASVLGDIKDQQAPLIRIHSECITGDLFASKRCDCGYQLKESLDLIAKNGSGIFIYLRQEGRGIGLKNKLNAYRLQDKGLDTIEANLKLGLKSDLRDYSLAVKLLKYFGITQVQAITNNPEKISALEKGGVTVQQRISIEPKANEINYQYIKTKKDKLGHLMSGPFLF